MNLCFIRGKIIEEVNFQFLYRSKNISVAKSKIALQNKSIITIVGYNEMADFMYRKLEVNSTITVQGRLRGNSKINMMVEVHAVVKEQE